MYYLQLFGAEWPLLIADWLISKGVAVYRPLCHVMRRQRPSPLLVAYLASTLLCRYQKQKEAAPGQAYFGAHTKSSSARSTTAVEFGEQAKSNFTPMPSGAGVPTGMVS